MLIKNDVQGLYKLFPDMWLIVDYKVPLRCGMLLMQRLLNRMYWKNIHLRRKIRLEGLIHICILILINPQNSGAYIFSDVPLLISEGYNQTWKHGLLLTSTWLRCVLHFPEQLPCMFSVQRFIGNSMELVINKCKQSFIKQSCFFFFCKQGKQGNVSSVST